MCTNVIFRHPAPFVSAPEGEGILGVNGAHWFVSLLHRIPELHIDGNLCQEDWGVVVFAKRNNKRFWIGLSAWNSDGFWLAHVHHRSFASWQRFFSSGKAELNRLACEMHAVLAKEPTVSEIAWYREKELTEANPQPHPRLNDGC
jgi:hypothetical protein